MGFGNDLEIDVLAAIALTENRRGRSRVLRVICLLKLSSNEQLDYRANSTTAVCRGIRREKWNDLKRLSPVTRVRIGIQIEQMCKRQMCCRK